jgi:hypothetical protein
MGWDAVSRPSSKRCGCRGSAHGRPITAANAAGLASTSQTRCSSDLVSPLAPVSSRPPDPPCALSPCRAALIASSPPPNSASTLESRITVVTLLARSPHSTKTNRHYTSNSRGSEHTIDNTVTIARAHSKAQVAASRSEQKREGDFD